MREKEMEFQIEQGDTIAVPTYLHLCYSLPE